MRRIMTLVVVAAMMVLALMAAAPAFAGPEDFLSDADGPPPEALNGLPAADSKIKTKPGTQNIVIIKNIDKATPTILE